VGDSTVQGLGCRVSLLGRFELSFDSRPVTVPVTARRIVAVLALHGPSARSRIAGSLWPDTTQARAQANLRTAVWRAHQVAPGLIVAEHESLALADGADVDVTRLVRAAHDVMADPAGRHR
jgi:DNA-binding SARP family transcriptional activator